MTSGSVELLAGTRVTLTRSGEPEAVCGVSLASSGLQTLAVGAAAVLQFSEGAGPAGPLLLPTAPVSTTPRLKLPAARAPPTVGGAMVGAIGPQRTEMVVVPLPPGVVPPLGLVAWVVLGPG